MHSPFIAAALEVKRIIPNAKIVMLVPDLPQFMHLTMSKTKRFLKALDWQYIKRAIKRIDKFALYSKHMAEFLKLKENSWCVLEGSINQNDVLNEEPEKDDNIVSVMYSGVADTRYGLPELLDAFSLIKEDNYELWITGIGNAVPLIKERAEKDSRIKYLGFLPSRKDLLLKQKSATMMINVRKPEEAASAYCFPSKLFEYMISGSPVLSFKIAGIPDEYFNYLIPMENSNPQTIADAILEVGSMNIEDRETLGKKSREFVLSNKNKNAQAEKLLAFALEDYKW
jgi:glycosyltransferase involved in cell wall biosynthesis